MQTVIYPGSVQSTMTYVQSPGSSWDFQSIIFLFIRAQDKLLQPTSLTVYSCSYYEVTLPQIL